MNKRQSGILLHISSLPGPYGIGDFGEGAYAFIDFLSASKQKLWQILPLNPTNPFWGNSPYSSHSAFAGNPLFISPGELIKDKLITDEDIETDHTFKEGPVDYSEVIAFKEILLDRAYLKFKGRLDLKKEFLMFDQQHTNWLRDYATFVMLKNHYGQIGWVDWPSDIKLHARRKIDSLIKENFDEYNKIKFIQFLIFRQWTKLKDYAHSKGVQIIGDLPIYVNYDSADVWKDTDNFKLDHFRKMKVVSGVPPDYFSKTGQRWGNPVFDWAYMKKTNFEWWARRIKQNLILFDYIRIDHFRALVNYWEIPAKEKTAINGYWVKSPTKAFFASLKDQFNELPFIAEDLGLIDEKTRIKIDALGFPGMKILLFAFNGDMKEHMYLPHNYNTNCVVYTGTHDNNTVKGWFETEATKEEKTNFRKYFLKHIGKKSDDNLIHWDMIELALHSKARDAIIPMQDILGLGEESRINIPGTIENNWKWRITSGQLNTCLSQRLADYTQESNR